MARFSFCFGGGLLSTVFFFFISVLFRFLPPRATRFFSSFFTRNITESAGRAQLLKIFIARGWFRATAASMFHCRCLRGVVSIRFAIIFTLPRLDVYSFERRARLRCGTHNGTDTTGNNNGYRSDINNIVNPYYGEKIIIIKSKSNRRERTVTRSVRIVRARPPSVLTFIIIAILDDRSRIERNRSLHFRIRNIVHGTLLRSDDR